MGYKQKYTEIENENFIQQLIVNYSNLYPLDDIGPPENPDLFRFFTRYHMRFKRGIGLLESKSEAKRLQDQASKFFRHYFQQMYKKIMEQGDIDESRAKQIINGQAQMWMMPWQLQRLLNSLKNLKRKRKSPIDC